MKRFLLLTICVVASVGLARAESVGRIVGAVLDRETGESITGATVVLVGTAFGASAGPQGRYELSELPEGVYTIHASRIGYLSEARSGIIVASEEEVSLDFRLERISLTAPEVVVTAARREQTARRTSATVSVVTGAEIARRGAVTFDRAVEHIPGVLVHRASELSANAVSIRGASDLRGGGIGNRVLLLIDGRPAITADTGGANWSLLPVDIIHRVEVVKGPFSALYGSNAMGGVVNLITKSAGGAGRTQVRIEGGFFGTPPEWMRYREGRSFFGSAGATRTGHLGQVGYLIHISSGSSAGYRQNSGFVLHNGYAKATYTLPGGTAVTGSVAAGTMERGYPHTWQTALLPLEVASNHINDRQEKGIFTWDLKASRSAGARAKLSARIYRQSDRSRSLLNPDGRTGDPNEFPPGFRLDTDGWGTGGSLQIDVWDMVGCYWILGGDARREAVYGRPDSVMYGKEHADGTALFVQAERTLRDDLDLSVGARLDERWIRGRREGQLSPKVGIAWRLDESTLLRASMGRAFRSPSLAELYLKREVNSGILFRRNPELKAERVHLSAEVGARREMGARGALDLTTFLYEFRDMVFWQWLGGTEYQAVNLNRAWISGVEAALQMQSMWGAFGRVGYAFLHARDLSPGRSDDTLPYKPRHTGYAVLGYRHDPVTTDLGLRYVGEIEEVVFYPNDRPEAFYTVDLRLEWTISEEPAWPGGRTALTFRVNNALDRQYEEMARYRMPGRSLSVRLATEW